MSLRGYLFGLKASALIAFFAWASSVLFINPDTSGVFGTLLFFSTLFLWMIGAIAIVSVWLYRKLFGVEHAVLFLGFIMRRSVFVSCLALSILMLRYYGVLAFWNGLIMFAFFLLIELYFVHHAPVRKSSIEEVSKGQSFRLKRSGLKV